MRYLEGNLRVERVRHEGFLQYACLTFSPAVFQVTFSIFASALDWAP